MRHDDESRKLRRAVQSINDRADQRPPDPILLTSGDGVMIVTTTISAMAGSTTGIGKAKVPTFTKSSRTLVPGTGPAIDIYNYHEKTFIGGAIIGVFLWSGVLWVDDVDKCGNYQ